MLGLKVSRAAIKALVFICVTMPFYAQAQVFKCVDPITKKTAYQPKPCLEDKLEMAIKLKKRTIAEEAAAVNNLREFEARIAKEEAIKAKKAKEEWEMRLRAAEVRAAQRAAAAQYWQADAQYRQAEAIRRLNTPLYFPLIRNR